MEFVKSGPVVAMELKGSNALEKWRTLLGPTDSAEARNKAPLSIRAKFGTGRECYFFFYRNHINLNQQLLDFLDLK